ncbi:cytochrome P450 [Actinocrispum wychmicini]|uniref:Cytochrome P450 n=1 Tax=Actinocrispum wychmicini TaxID=1213861 RepID=A0A4R2JPA8_9PSEU|nr:cytochrome P450 [Actinocrispum wychmicini]TCO60827.1 hypothetical protein EV192_103408 [Actinocrispum wychmicini]
MNRARSGLIWAIRYGLPGVGLRVATARGDLIARVVADPEVLADPFPVYEQLRAQGPVASNPFIRATTHHATANMILRNDEFVDGDVPLADSRLGRLVSAASDPHSLGPFEAPSLLGLHPPEHTRIRRLVSRAFTPKAVAQFGDRIQQIADELLDDIIAGPPVFDLMETYASLLPVTVIAEMLGVPTAMRKQFLAWGNDGALTLDPGLSWRDYKRAQVAVRTSHHWLDQHIANLRANPGEDLLSQLVQVVDEGDRLTDTELRVTALLILGAGFETTVNLIGNGAALLLAHPEQLDLLRDDPGRWNNAIGEILRYDSPVQITLRTAGRDTHLLDRPIRKGRSVIVMLGGANRDPAVFTDPHRFDIGRENAREHLAFSAGIHYCLGAQLARLEAAIALRTLFDRLPELTSSGAPTRGGTRVLRGYRQLPLRAGRAASQTATNRTTVTENA